MTGICCCATRYWIRHLLGPTVDITHWQRYIDEQLRPSRAMPCANYLWSALETLVTTEGVMNPRLSKASTALFAALTCR